MSKVFYSMFGSFAVAIVIMTYIDYSLAANCDGVVREEQFGVLNWLGNVTFRVPVTANGWMAVAQFDQAFTGVGVWQVWVTSRPEEGISEFTNREENANLNAGDILTFRFRVNYGRDIPKPQVTSLKFQGIEMCA